MYHFQHAIARLTALYVVILMALSLACSIWLYTVAGQEIYTVSQQRDASSGTISASIALTSASQQRLLQSLIFFNVFIFGAGTLASYALAKRTLRPIQQSYQAQAQFAADASHELRTPLTALKAELQLAQRKKTISAAEYEATLQSSLEEVERLTSLTNRLLRLANPTGQSPAETASLQAALHGARKQLRHAFSHKNMQLTLPADDTNLHIHADDLTEMLTIVLDNAVKFSPPGTTVAVNLRSSRGQATINITDQGQGIAAADLPHIFERFRRGSHKSDAKGYGLGLAVAKKLADNANGTISAQSKPGQGTTITIRLLVSG